MLNFDVETRIEIQEYEMQNAMGYIMDMGNVAMEMGFIKQVQYWVVVQCHKHGLSKPLCNNTSQMANRCI